VKNHYVYSLHEGFSNQPFYVGVTEHPKRRLNAHKAAADGRRQDSLTGCGIKSADISMRILAACDERHTAELIEQCLIEHYRLIIINQKRVKVAPAGS
jgi:predicted GIY-YIG superfamily endonuclease